MNLWKNTLVTSSLMTVFSKRLSKVQPRPRYLKAQGMRSKSGAASCQVTSVLPLLHRANKRDSFAIETNSSKVAYGILEGLQKICQILGYHDPESEHSCQTWISHRKKIVMRRKELEEQRNNSYLPLRHLWWLSHPQSCCSVSVHSNIPCLSLVLPLSVLTPSWWICPASSFSSIAMLLKKEDQAFAHEICHLITCNSSIWDAFNQAELVHRAPVIHSLTKRAFQISDAVLSND